MLLQGARFDAQGRLRFPTSWENTGTDGKTTREKNIFSSWLDRAVSFGGVTALPDAPRSLDRDMHDAIV
jgi:hypothetical protein